MDMDLTGYHRNKFDQAKQAAQIRASCYSKFEELGLYV